MYEIAVFSVIFFVLLVIGFLYIFRPKVDRKIKKHNDEVKWSTINPNVRYSLENSINSSNSSYPLIIHQTCKELYVPDGIKRSVDSWRLYNSSCEHRYYTHDNSVDFIRKYFDKKTLDAYHLLIDNKHKQRLFSYCILYIYGGIFANIDTVCKSYIVKHMYHNSSIENVVICSAPQNKLLLNYINEMVESIHKREKEIYPNTQFTKIDNNDLLEVTYEGYSIDEKAVYGVHQEQYKEKAPSSRIIDNPYEKGIPERIIQTFDTECVSFNMRKALHSWKKLHKTYTYEYYTNEMRRRDVKDYSIEALSAYDTLLPSAFKTDLWKLCTMYTRGGIYADCDTVCLESIDELIRDVDMVICVTNCRKYINNVFIACIKELPVIKKCVENIINNISKKNYSAHYLKITGSIAFTQTIVTEMNSITTKSVKVNKKNEVIRFQTIETGYRKLEDLKVRILKQEGEYIYDKDKKIIKTKYDTYDNEILSTGGNNYMYMWNKKLVYR